jgi:predicted dinucleotide-binding enzyme
MRIGIIGAGDVAQAFARKAIDAGHQVVFSNSRGKESLAPAIAKFGAAATAPAEAVENPIVLLACPG